VEALQASHVVAALSLGAMPPALESQAFSLDSVGRPYEASKETFKV